MLKRSPHECEDIAAATSLSICIMLISYSLQTADQSNMAEGKSPEELVESIKHYRILIQNNPTNHEYHQKIAQLYFAQNNINDALVHYRIALLIEPKNGQLLLEYANALNGNNSPECAYEIYQAINEAGISTIGVSYNMAYTLKKMDKLDETIALCKRIIAQSPDLNLHTLLWLLQICNW